MKGETQQFLELALRENAMLKNSLNIYAENAAKAIDKCDAVLQSSIQARNEITNLAQALDTFVFRAMKTLRMKALSKTKVRRKKK